MGIHPEILHHNGVQLQDYDYSAAGLYFVTICTHQRRHLFGEIVHGRMYPNDAGARIALAWKDIPAHHAGVIADAFVVMPNHVHGIISTGAARTSSNLHQDTIGAHAELAAINRPISVGEIIRAFKVRCALALNNDAKRFCTQIWQEHFHEHIIREQNEYEEMVRYIENNPALWQHDIYHRNPRDAVYHALLQMTRQQNQSSSGAS